MAQAIRASLLASAMVATFVGQQTSAINAIRAHLAEFGVTAPVGRKGIEELLRVIADPSDKRVPDVVRARLAALGSHRSDQSTWCYSP